MTQTGVHAQRRIARDTAQLVVRTVLQQVFGFARGLVLPNVLGPLHYGSLATILIVERYSTFVNLNVHAATLYRAPQLLARGAADEARRIHDDVVGFSALTGAFAGVGLMLWTWWYRDRLGSELASGLMVAAFLPLLIPVRGALLIWSRVNGDFHAVSRSGIISAVILFALTILFGYVWQTVGVVAGHVIAYAVVVGYLIQRPETGLRLAVRPRDIRTLLQTGAPMAVLSAVMIYLVTVDRLTIAAQLSVEAVGYYAIGQLLAGVLLLVPNAVGEAIGPTLIADSQSDALSTQPLMFRITIVIAIMVALVAAAMIAALPGVVELAFSRYRPAIPAAQLLCVVAYFEAVGLGAHYVVSSRGDMKVYIAYAAALAAGAYFLLPVIGRRGGVAAVAGGMIVLTAARTLWLSWMARRLTGAARTVAFQDVLTLLLIGLAAGVVPLAFQTMLTAPNPDPLSIGLGAVGRVAATLTVLLILGWVCVPAQLRITLSAARRVFARLDPSSLDADAPVGPPST